MKSPLIDVLISVLMRRILLSESHCIGSLSFSRNYLSRKANFTSLTCKDWQKGSTICVAKRNLASEHSEFIDFRCPPEDKDVVQCDLVVSRSNPFACQYYRYRHSPHSTPSLIQHCCCHKHACMEPIARVEYEQRHLRRITVNPETVFLFWTTIVINVMTVVVFFDQIVAFFADAYDRNWGCHVSKHMLNRRNINQLQTQLRTLGLCDFTAKRFTLTTAIIEQQFIADYHRQLDISVRYMPIDMDPNEPSREQFFRRERSLIQGLRSAEQLIKICNSSWRGRERMSMGDRRRKKILDIEARVS